MTILALSPHLDDAAFSAGGSLATWARAGHEVVVATVFTRSVEAPAGFALACQTDKGIAPDVDYLALRRDEDAAACAALDAEPVWLGLPEAPHRGYHTAEALFGPPHAGDRDAWRDVRAAAHVLVAARRPSLVVTCQGLGGHVDHRHVVRAAQALDVPCAWWRDVPYVLRAPYASAPFPEHAVPLDAAALGAKIEACQAYASQLGYQFGRNSEAEPAEVLREQVSAFARAEAARRGLSGTAEVLASRHALPREAATM